MKEEGKKSGRGNMIRNRQLSYLGAKSSKGKRKKKYYGSTKKEPSTIALACRVELQESWTTEGISKHLKKDPEAAGSGDSRARVPIEKKTFGETGKRRKKKSEEAERDMGPAAGRRWTHQALQAAPREE